MARQQIHPPGAAAGGTERLRAQLAECGSEIASAVATANALSRKVAAELASSEWAEANVRTPPADRAQRKTQASVVLPFAAAGRTSDVPAALSGCMQELSRLASDLIAACRRTRLNPRKAVEQPSAVAPTNIELLGGGPRAAAWPPPTLSQPGAQTDAEHRQYADLRLRYAQLSRDHGQLQQQIAALKEREEDRPRESGMAHTSTASAGGPKACTDATSRLIVLLERSVKALDGAAKRLESAIEQPGQVRGVCESGGEQCRG